MWNDRRRSTLFVLLTLAPVWLSGCGGHVIRPEFAPNQNGRPFDFAKPPCRTGFRPELPPADAVTLRYLGAGGLYVEWQGNALLTGPFFSNPGLFRVPRGRLILDPDAVRSGLDGMDLYHVRAIAVGHSHYDHLAEIPLITEAYAPGARVYVNQTGAHALAPIRHLAGRLYTLEDQNDWIWLYDEDTNKLPIRFRPVESEHAPHFWGIRLAGGEIDGDWTEDWSRRRFLSLRTGKTFAFVIDLMSSDLRTPLFRIYHQDSANPRNKGFPQFETKDERCYDLAVLCMASFQFVKQHPESILGRLKPRHVLVTHYENFFRSTRKPVHFVLFLTDGFANRFLHRTRDALRLNGVETAGPEGAVCGASSSGWTMPMPGEWLRFRVPG